MNTEPQDDNIGEPAGTVSGTQEPSVFAKIKQRLGWWGFDVKRTWQIRREIDALLPVLRHGSEQELRGCKVPFPRRRRDLQRIVDAVVKRQHDYGTCVYAMSIAAEASFNYVSHVLGCTGFQASCADLDFLRRTRLMKYGFQIINYENLLYPQYKDKFPTREQVLRDNIDQIGKAAEELLSERDAHPNVRRHWEDLVDMRRLATKG